MNPYDMRLKILRKSCVFFAFSPFQFWLHETARGLMLGSVVRQISVCFAIWSTIFPHTKTGSSSPRHFWTMVHQVSQSYTIFAICHACQEFATRNSNSLFFFGQQKSLHRGPRPKKTKSSEPWRCKYRNDDEINLINCHLWP